MTRAQMRELRELVRAGLVEWSRCRCGEWVVELVELDHPRLQLWLAHTKAETFH
jgi:hypothetical protein